VRFLRHRPEDEAAESTAVDTEAEQADTQSAKGHTPSKGRPTPKRRDAEGKRRGPAPPPPKTQREALKLAKTNKARYQERRRAKGSPQRNLRPQDRGPVKEFVRDYVDARRHLIGLFMPLALLVFVSLLLRNPVVQSYISMFTMAMVAVIAVEGVLLGRRVTRQARERFPKEHISGAALGWYAFSRASQLRKLRVPTPRVKIGASV
jgi:hypothetical protein